MFGEFCFALWGFSWLIILICYFLIFWVCYSQHGFPDAKGPLIGILSRLFAPSLWRFSNFDGTKDRRLRPQLELVEVHACTGRDTSQMLQFVELRHHWFQSLKVNETCSTQIESKGNHPNRLQDTASSFQWHCFWLFDSTASAPFRSFGTAACIFWVTFPSWSWQEWYFEIFWGLLWWNMMKPISCTVPKIWKSSMSFCTYFAIFGQSRPKKALNQSWHVRFGCAFWMCQDFNKMLSRFQMLLEHKMPNRRSPRLERFNRSCALCLISAPEPVLNRCHHEPHAEMETPMGWTSEISRTYIYIYIHIMCIYIYIMCIYIIYGQYHLLIYLFILL